MSLTVAQFRERLDKQVLAQLSDSDGDLEDVVKLGHALTDAAAQIQGYLYKVPEADRPPEATLDAYQVALALYVLAGNRPGVEFDSIRARAKAAIAYFEAVKSDAAKATENAAANSTSVDVQVEAPTPLMVDADLTLFGGPFDAGAT